MLRTMNDTNAMAIDVPVPAAKTEVKTYLKGLMWTDEDGMS